MRVFLAMRIHESNMIYKYQYFMIKLVPTVAPVSIVVLRYYLI